MTSRVACPVLPLFLAGMTGLPFAPILAQQIGAARPTAVVAVRVDSSEFEIIERQYRVLYNRVQARHIPLIDYDFPAALAEELLTSLAQDERIEWKLLPAGLRVELVPRGTNLRQDQVLLGHLRDMIDAVAVTEDKTPARAIAADRLLLIHIRNFGAVVGNSVADNFEIKATVSFIDRKDETARGWAGATEFSRKSYTEKTAVGGKLKELQADNQKGLKEKINKLLEQFCGKAVAELKKARI